VKGVVKRGVDAGRLGEDDPDEVLLLGVLDDDLVERGGEGGTTWEA